MKSPAVDRLKLKGIILLEYLFIAIFSLIAFLPIFGGILGSMIAAAFGLAFIIYFFWDILAFIIQSFVPEIPQAIDFFNGFLVFPFIETSLITFFAISIFILGTILFFSGVYQITISRVKKTILIDNYAYKICRHPQILGLLLISFAIFLYIPTLWSTNSFGYEIRIGDLYSLILFWIIWILEAKWEENRLINKFQSQYVQYKSETAFIFPFTKRIDTFLSRFSFTNNFPCQILISAFLFFLFVILTSVIIATNNLVYLTK